VIAGIVGALILFLVVAMIVAVARDQGATAVDVALGYELAWDRLDFDAVYRLSGSELRDGLNRDHFVEAKRAAYKQQGTLGNLIQRATVEESIERVDAATVDTCLELRDGGTVRNRVELHRRAREWLVVGYDLRPANA
jgi:hypothetical protein